MSYIWRHCSNELGDIGLELERFHQNELDDVKANLDGKKVN